MQHEILVRSSTTAEVEVVSSNLVKLEGMVRRHKLVGTRYIFTRVFTETDGLYEPSLEVEITTGLAAGFAATPAWQDSTPEEREFGAQRFGRQLYVKRVSAVRVCNRYNTEGVKPVKTGRAIEISYTDGRGRQHVKKWMPIREIIHGPPFSLDDPALIAALREALARVGAALGAERT
jgi:hypothetical protein